jgi:hypothetical protein
LSPVVGRVRHGAMAIVGSPGIMDVSGNSFR